MGEKKSRSLTKAEERRKAEFEQLKEKMEEKGYTCQDLTVSILTANWMAILLAIPFVVLFGWLFWICNGSFLFGMGKASLILLPVLYIICIFLHEGIHGLTFGLFARRHFQAISFGFIPQYLTPYCTCKDPLSKGAYLTGALMPTLVLGIVTSVLSAFCGVPILFYLGSLLIIGGGGDMTIALKILGHRSNAKESVFLDHPCECGVVVFEK